MGTMCHMGSATPLRLPGTNFHWRGVDGGFIQAVKAAGLRISIFSGWPCSLI
jgi:hypothetical protein